MRGSGFPEAVANITLEIMENCQTEGSNGEKETSVKAAGVRRQRVHSLQWKLHPVPYVVQGETPFCCIICCISTQWWCNIKMQLFHNCVLSTFWKYKKFFFLKTSVMVAQFVCLPVCPFYPDPRPRTSTSCLDSISLLLYRWSDHFIEAHTALFCYQQHKNASCIYEQTSLILSVVKPEVMMRLHLTLQGNSALGSRIPSSHQNL